VILTLTGQAFHIRFKFVVTQRQTEVGCVADTIDKIVIQLVSEQRLTGSLPG
jgi:hypothetical protein